MKIIKMLGRFQEGREFMETIMKDQLRRNGE